MNPPRPSADALPATTKRVLASIPGGSAFEAVAERMQAVGEGGRAGGVGLFLMANYGELCHKGVESLKGKY